jgi:hypothetical protein
LYIEAYFILKIDSSWGAFLVFVRSPEIYSFLKGVWSNKNTSSRIVIEIIVSRNSHFTFSKLIFVSAKVHLDILILLPRTVHVVPGMKWVSFNLSSAVLSSCIAYKIPLLPRSMKIQVCSSWNGDFDADGFSYPFSISSTDHEF